MQLANSSQYAQERIDETKLLLVGRQIKQDEFDIWKIRIMLAKRKLQRIERERHPQASEIEVQSAVLQRLAALISTGELPPLEEYV